MVPWGALATVLGPSAVVFIPIWGLYQVYAPKYVNRDTLYSDFKGEIRTEVANAVDQIDGRLDQMDSRVDDVEDHIDRVDEMQEYHIQVSRAMARALDPDKDAAMDSDEVDKYLVENGVHVGKFLSANEDGDHTPPRPRDHNPADD